MKKISAMLLAIVLVVAMAPVAVAAGTPQLITIGSTFALEDAYGRVSTKVATDFIAGQTLYYEVSAVDSKAPLQIADLRGYEIQWRINNGGVRITNISFVSKNNDSGDERVYLAVKLKDTFQNVSDPTIDAEITITAPEGCGITDRTRAATDTYALPMNGDVLYGVAENIGSGPYSVSESIFDFAQNADNVTLCFDRNIEVSGNMSGEKNLFLRLSTCNESLQSEYPYAQLRLFDGNRKTFRRPVTVKIPITPIEGKNGKPTAPHLYEWRDGKLKTVEGAAYSLADEMFIITTKTLGNYIISDEVLEAAIDEKPTEPEIINPEQWALPNGVEENPQTGGAGALARSCQSNFARRACKTRRCSMRLSYNL